MNLRLIFLLLFLHVLLTACRQKTAFWLESLPNFGKLDSSFSRGKLEVIKREYFLTHGFVYNETSIDSIDAWVEKNKTSDFEKYRTYFIYIYNLSGSVNIEKFKADRRNLDDEDIRNSLLYVYRWSYGHFDGRSKYKNYEMVEPENHIILEDIPQEKQ